ncbi:MAG: acyl-CoA/acyl-ACP dehydrogenase [Actinobacteria bacterium]|nr:acyl-CoA/acyl-ACP dehydrogenase [Actinomycetota bacterium]
MNFDFTEEQQAVRELSAQIFEGHATVERVKAVERSDDRVDRELWKALAAANLLGIALPPDAGGSGFGIIELCLLLEQQGRFVAPVPLWPTLVLGAAAVARFGSPQQRERWLPGVVNGDAVLTAALAEPGENDPTVSSVSAHREGTTWRLEGAKPSVPAGHVADAMLVPARVADQTGTLGVFLVETTAAGVDRERAVTTNREAVTHVRLDGAPADLLATGAEAIGWMLDRSLVGLCAMQVGVAEAALRMAAEYTSNRHQFGKPLSTFQGVALKAADAYIDTEAMRVTLWQAAWKLSEDRDAAADVLVAKWWASEGGQRVVHTTQHLHGGLGADVDYPIHRYFLWGKQIEDTLGGASATLARLGTVLAGAKR